MPHRPPTPFSSTNQPAPEAKSAGQAVAAEIRARIAEHKEAILEAQMARALSPMHPQGHQAAKDLLDRIMPPETKTDLTSGGERMATVTVVSGVERDGD